MKERAINMSGDEVRGVLAGTKTQARRLVKGHVVGIDDGLPCSRIVRERNGGVSERDVIACPYGQVGDRLWVRETWNFDPTIRWDFKPTLGRYDLSGIDLTTRLWFAADFAPRYDAWERDVEPGVVHRCERWRPSIHMPRWASRITLEVTGVRVERGEDGQWYWIVDFRRLP